MREDNEKEVKKSLEWLHTWGFGHEHPQLVMSEIVPVDRDEQNRIEEYYLHLPQKLHA